MAAASGKQPAQATSTHAHEHTHEHTPLSRPSPCAARAAHASSTSTRPLLTRHEQLVARQARRTRQATTGRGYRSLVLRPRRLALRPRVASSLLVSVCICLLS